MKPGPRMMGTFNRRDLEMIQAAIDGATNQDLMARFRLTLSAISSTLSEARSSGYAVPFSLVRQRMKREAEARLAVSAGAMRALPPPAGPTIDKSSLRELVERGIPATRIAALLRLPYAEVKAMVDAVGHSAGFSAAAAVPTPAPAARGTARALRPKPIPHSNPWHGAYNG